MELSDRHLSHFRVFSSLQKKLHTFQIPPSFPSLYPFSKSLVIYFLSPFCLFWTYVNESYVVFCDRLLSPSLKFWKFMGAVRYQYSVVACIVLHSFSWPNTPLVGAIYIYIYTHTTSLFFAVMCFMSWEWDFLVTFFKLQD